MQHAAREVSSRPSRMWARHAVSPRRGPRGRSYKTDDPAVKSFHPAGWLRSRPYHKGLHRRPRHSGRHRPRRRTGPRISAREAFAYAMLRSSPMNATLPYASPSQHPTTTALIEHSWCAARLLAEMFAHSHPRPPRPLQAVRGLSTSVLIREHPQTARDAAPLQRGEVADTSSTARGSRLACATSIGVRHMIHRH